MPWLSGQDLARVAWNETWSVISQVMASRTVKLALPGNWEKKWWAKKWAALLTSETA